MKGTAAWLVVMGVILILTPVVMDYLYQSAYLAAEGAAVQNIVRTPEGGYRVFLVIFGTIMVFIGVGMGFASLERGPRTG